MEKKYPFALNMFGREAKVRGLYLTVACDFEKILSDITLRCEEPDISKRDILKLKLPSEMGKKLERCKLALQNYNLSYYNHFISQFEVTKELLPYRNMLAHGFSLYDPEKSDESFITFIWFERGKERIDKIDISSFMQKIEHFRKHISLLYTLHSKIHDERGDE